MKIAATVTRYLLGLIFVVFGLNGFLNFLPMPEGMPDSAMSYMGSLMEMNMMPFVKVLEIVAGALLLANKAVPLAVTILGAIAVNIFFFHAFLTPGIENSIMPIGIIVMLIIQLIDRKESFKALLS